MVGLEIEAKGQSRELRLERCQRSRRTDQNNVAAFDHFSGWAGTDGQIRLDSLRIHIASTLARQRHPRRLYGGR